MELKRNMKSQLLCFVLLLAHFSRINCAVHKPKSKDNYKNEFTKFKQLFQYNLQEIANNYKQKQMHFDQKVLSQLKPQEKSILKEFHRIGASGDQSMSDLSDYLRTVDKYEKIKAKMQKHSKLPKKAAETRKRRLRLKAGPTRSKPMAKHRRAETNLQTERKAERKSGVFTANESQLLHKLYHIKNRILASKSQSPRKLPAKAVQKGNRVWGGATYVKLGQEHAPVYIDQSPSYLYSAPKFKTNQNGVELPLPDPRAFSPKRIPIAATFGTRPDDLNTKYYGDADEYKYQGKSNQAIDIQKAWTLPQPGFMPVVQKYPANQRELIQIDSAGKAKGEYSHTRPSL